MPESREEETIARQADAQDQGAAESAKSAGTEDSGGLDLEGLDLTVETVEERISPSETNVFDK